MISFALILRNAEKTIKNTLESIKPYADEIVVALDTRTTDKTREILEKYNSVIYDYQWIDTSFATARNFVLSKCTKDWVFVIDGDEVLENFEYPSNEYDYYLVIQQHWKNNKPDCEFYTARFYKRNLDIKYQFAIHETLETSLKDKRGYSSNIVLKHKEKSEEEIKEKTRKLLEEHFKQLKNEPNNPYVKGQIAFCYRNLSEWANCKDFAFLSLLMDRTFIYGENGASIYPHKAQICNLLFECYMNEGREDIAIQYLNLSIKLCNEQLMAHANLYGLLKGTYPEAAELEKQECLRIGQNSKLPFDILINNLTF